MALVLCISISLYYAQRNAQAVHYAQRNAQAVHYAQRNAQAVHYAQRNAQAVHYAQRNAQAVHYAQRNAQAVHQRDVNDGNETVIHATDSHRLLRNGGGCIEKQNVFFLKIQKTGSTTVQQLLLRFGLVRDLSFMLFVNKWSYPSPIFTHLLLPEPSRSTGFDGRYNILCEHTVYSEPELKKLMPNDTFYLANLRHPFTHIKSYINYYTMFTELNISSTKHFLSELLRDPVRHDKANSTRNVMATFFGLPRAVSDPAAGDALIRLVDEKFDLVLIMEHIDESLVLMKRRLCWTLKDILYLPLRVEKYEGKANGKEDQEQLIARHRDWSPIDYAIYDHFARKLQVGKLVHDLVEYIFVNKLLTYLLTHPFRAQVWHIRLLTHDLASSLYRRFSFSV